MTLHSRCKRSLVSSLLVLAAAIPALAADPPASPKSPANKPDAQTPQKPRVLVTISTETTYITEPLRKDGYPDYVAALDQRCRQGVTAENNAAVLFWKAVGPRELRIYENSSVKW